MGYQSRRYSHGSDASGYDREDRPRSYYSSDSTPLGEDTYSRFSKRRRGSEATNTYGTYIYEIASDDHGRYHTNDPARCNCRCCPHPRRNPYDSVSSARRSEEMYRRGDGGSQAESRGYYQTRPSLYARTPRHPTYDTDYQRSHDRNSRRGQHGVYSPAHSSGYYRMNQDRPATRQAGVRSQEDIIVEVVDRTAMQHLRARYGKRFPMSISPGTTSARDISNLLAPDSRRERVVVKWPNGELEPLDDLVPITDLGSQGTRLEVRTRKNVHWT
ncbi:hypothetical protein CC79DRAFT_1369264 [Sarocladium strictum]